MDTKPTEEELSKVQEAISLLAEVVSCEIKPDKQSMEKILHNVGLNNGDWGREILERACSILDRAHNDLNCTKKSSVIAELKFLGMKEFPAILTYEKAKAKPLSIEPSQIDFDNIAPGEESNATLKVTGGVVKDVSASNRLKLNLIRSGDGSNLIKVTVYGSVAGEFFTDYVLVRSDKGELKVPVTIRVLKAPLTECCECGRHTDDLISLGQLRDARVKVSLPDNRKFVCKGCWAKESGESNTISKEPPLLSWCPDCGDKIKKKSLFYNHYGKRYECFSCKHIFQYPDKRVDKYNDTRH